MMQREPANSVVSSVALDGTEIEEHLDKKYTIIRSPKRVEYIRITTTPRFGQCVVHYESGKEVPGLTGKFTSMVEAKRLVLKYLEMTTQSKEAKYKERWGDKPIPEVKTKRQRKPKNAPSNNENLNVS